jgi:hypothetical protein
LANQSIPVPNHGPVEAVDEALRVTGRRAFFTPDEALELLHCVQAGVPEGALGATIAGIVADAAVAYADQMMVDRVQLADPLLDIRLVLAD